MDPGPARKRLYLVAGAGFILELIAVFLIVARDTSIAVAAPLLLIGMFMTFAPAISAKRGSGPRREGSTHGLEP